MRRLLICVLVVVGLVLPQMVLAKNKIATASDYAKIEKNHEAKKLLDEAILEDPLDADVHYQAGLVYRQLGMTGDFDLAMKNACKLKSSYCSKVAGPYYSLAFNQLNSGSQRSAIRSFEKAFIYQPAKQTEAVNRLFASGKSLLSSKNRTGAEMYFSVLAYFSPSHKEQIAKLYFDMGQNTASKEAIEYYRLASKYSNAYKKQIGDDLASMAKNNEYSKKERAALKKEAGKYLSDKEMLVHFPPPPPTKINLKLGVLYVTKPLKKGELSPLWIGGPGIPAKRSYGQRGGKDIAIVLDNGKQYNIFRGELPPPDAQYRFKFKGLEDGAIGIAQYDPL